MSPGSEPASERRRRRSGLAATVFALAGVFTVSASAETLSPGGLSGLSEAPGEALTVGRITREICAECHGPDGNSRYPWVPNLAGQNPEYLLEQLTRFRQGQRVDHVMSGIVGLLDEARIQALAEHYGGLVNLPIQVGAPQDVERGSRLYQQRCKECHGEDGRGRAGFAWIAGQQIEYVRRTLQGYRDGRKTRFSEEMRAATQALTDSEISALASYLATLR